MIADVHAKLLAATAPSRSLDCELHEVLTGQLDLQKDGSGWSRQVAREHGDMLVDMGSERLRIRVPRYTECFEDAVKLKPPNLGLMVTMEREKEHRTVDNKMYCVSLLIEEKENIYRLNDVLHDNLALAVCLVMTSYTMGVKDNAQSV